MNELQLPRNSYGEIERYNASQKLEDQVSQNFTERGLTAGRLVLVTLTETPYRPSINGITFEKEVSNVYQGYGGDGGKSTDTVVEARMALDEFLRADVAGTKKIKLETFDTRYQKILRDVLPKSTTKPLYKNAFEEALVESCRRTDINVDSPKTALEIIKHAPKRIDLLRLTGYVPVHSGQPADNEAVTKDGRMIRTYTRKVIGILGNYYPEYLSLNVGLRGGNAPGSRIVSDITRRVIDLRTKSSKR